MVRFIRRKVESITERVPRGPLGFVGNGNLVGAVNFFTVAAVNGIIPIDGLEVGYNIESHSVERRRGEEMHTFIINSANKDVARFAARFNSAPSNVDFVLEDTEVTDIEPIEERRTFTTWEVEVRVKDRESVEGVTKELT